MAVTATFRKFFLDTKWQRSASNLVIFYALFALGVVSEIRSAGTDLDGLFFTWYVCAATLFWLPVMTRERERDLNSGRRTQRLDAEKDNPYKSALGASALFSMLGALSTHYFVYVLRAEFIFLLGIVSIHAICIAQIVTDARR